MAHKLHHYRGYVVADRRFYDELGRSDLECDLEKSLRTLSDPEVMITSGNGIWAMCRPLSVPALPPHGWKIHVSARPDQAVSALAAVMDEFRRSPFHFKCLRDRDLVLAATSRWWPVGQVGKVITIYAHTAEECRSLLERLHPRLVGVIGPYVLTDRRYRDSTCLYYRYGEFEAERRLESDGTQTALITGPDGAEWVEDRRPTYRRPPWVPDLFDADQSAEAGPSEHVINGYRVHTVLQHTGCGGVYLADRVSDGTKVVLKEARPHVAFAPDGSDGQARLRKEYEALQAMAGSRISPEPYELFTAWEHLFLAQEYIDASPLIPFAATFNPLAQGRSTEQTRTQYRQMCSTVIAGLHDAVRICHERGLCFGDLSPGNVLIDPDTLKVWLIDFECARPLASWRPELPVTPGFTPDVGSPSLSDGRLLDEFGMAAIEQALVFPTNMLRVLNPDALARSTRYAGTLLDWPVEDLLERVELPTSDGTGPGHLEVIVKESIRFIENVLTLDRDDRVAPGDPKLFSTNPWSVAHGAAGILRALSTVTGAVPAGLLDWMSSRRDEISALPPGLYSGAAGVGWTLLECGETDLGRFALDVALDQSFAGLGSDVDSGWAGLGLAALAGWQATGDEGYRDRAATIGEHVIRSAADSGTGLYWPVEGQTKHSVGYLYGSSGVATFLLYLHCATGEARFLTVGRRALNHDLAQASDRMDGGLGFPAHVDVEQREPYWERGSAGVAGALARYAKVTGSTRYLTALERTVSSNLAGAAVFPGLFLGMAGLVNLALDCHTLFGERRYLELAAGMTAGITAMACTEPEGIAFPGNGLMRYSTDFASGSAGIALVLDRLNRGGPDFNYTLDALLSDRHA